MAVAEAEMKYRNPKVAAVLSLILPGLGQLYVGKSLNLVSLISYIAIWIFSIFRVFNEGLDFTKNIPPRHAVYPYWQAVLFLAGCALAILIYSAVDAYRSAVRFNNPILEKELGRSLWTDAWIRLRRNKLAILGMWLVVLLVTVANLAPYLSPHDPIDIPTKVIKQRVREGQYPPFPPDATFPLGTDDVGRCILSRIIWGSRISLMIGILAQVISVIIGVLIGALAGYYNKLDNLLMRLTDVFMAFPFVLFVIVLVNVLGPSLWTVMWAIGVLGWMGTARIVRGQILSLKEKEFTEAARALGDGDWRIIWKHILPNTLSPIIVYATLGVGGVIMTEAALSFLGMGTQPPTPSWGLMVNQGRSYLAPAPWISITPGIAIMLVVFGFNLFGDGLRDALDPRLKH